MKMVHSLHKSAGTVLFDDCQACKRTALVIEELDTDSLMWLADKATALSSQFDDPDTHGLSMNERRAISRLRMYARVVFRSGIPEEVAQ